MIIGERGFGQIFQHENLYSIYFEEFKKILQNY